eukprot:gnl/TRDRNA2_/TRDRNA2_197374_c0_seq1.p1 gnl/TRDRNA2_/TRDRNA2_197374_c0~~gnl/TRDRNA2_/TRDRNA2_197374_c0_seq1.p1  ORF type:complete len:217 (-),score=36.27 gnl/TRDRNA2_/TRDRNA2_197374_c0_seq1:143-793(-)
MLNSIGRAIAYSVDTVWTGLFTAVGVYTLSYLDKYPLPHLNMAYEAGGIYDFDLEDVKFWAPPHAAIAIILFSSKNYPELLKTVLGILVSTLIAVSVVQGYHLVEKEVLPHVPKEVLPYVDELMVTRALSVSLSMMAMSFIGGVYAPGGALAVLFIDKPDFHKNIGKAYWFMPGMTGTLVLLAMAYVKVTIGKLLGSVFGLCCSRQGSADMNKKRK